LSLVPAVPGTPGPARGTPVAAAGAPAGAPALRPGGDAGLELQVARTADLVLKLHRLLERAQRREVEPERAARMARLARVVEQGQVALRRAAEHRPDAAAADAAAPGPRDQG